MKTGTLAERQILKAQAEGKLDDLDGAGKPLRQFDNYDVASEVGFRLMAEAGALPLEIRLRKSVAEQTVRLAGTTDPDQQKREMAVLAELQQRLSMQEEARRRFFSTT